jgi:16S rRNA (guanine527-N7)-methyltransferase
MSATAHELALRLNELLLESGEEALDASTAERFGEYGALLLRWNARMNLTAIRDEDGILRRHFVECIRAARALPTGLETLLDFGSGAGFPGIPIALCRPEIAVTLGESQNKKAMFLREAVRTLGLSAVVHADRAETLGRQFDCVALRAVDKMEEALRAAVPLIRPGGWLAVLTTTADAPGWQSLAASFTWVEPVPIGGEGRVLMTGIRDQASGISE